MSEQLRSIDPSIREQLARRASGRLPEGLAAEVFTALDSAPPKRTIWRVPRLAVAAMGMILIAVLAVSIGFSAVHTGPAATATSFAGYPAERAMTTAELASLMAGPPLPQNTALVASVTIDARTDVCPMNSRPTVGVIEGMGSQVCVMGADLNQQLPGPTTTGAFAFRYMAPGYLGLLGQITPASTSGLAFKVADDWPLAGTTFLAKGWLYQGGLVGNDPTVCGQVTPDPNGTYACTISWLSDASNAAASDDANGLPGPPEGVPARSVSMAAGIADIDHISSRENGVFVVASVNGPCPSAAPQDSQGCATWRVLAKLADITLPAPDFPSPAATPTPTTAPPATPLAPSLTGVIGTGNRPLTVDELETLMVGQPDHLAGRIVIVEAPIPTQISCQSDANGGGCAVNTKPLAQTGIWAVSIGAEGALRLVGQITTPTGRGLVARGYVFTLDELNAATNLNAGDSLIVDGWLLEYILTCDFGATPLPAGCGPYSTIASTASDNSPATFYVQRGAFEEFTGSAGDWTVEGPPVHGLFLVRVSNPNGGTLLARLEPVTP